MGMEQKIPKRHISNYILTINKKDISYYEFSS